MKVLITGGAGYIGSHIAVELLKENVDVIIVDNLRNSKIEVIDKIEQIAGKRPIFYQYDVRDEIAMRVDVFGQHKIDYVIHLAGLKAVGESMKNPDMYYRYNLDVTTSLICTMQSYNCHEIIFSSTATVYEPKPKLEEYDYINPMNTYANTKYIQELIFENLFRHHNWNVTILRYFNPIGAHPSGLIGEDPNGIPNNLMPYINKVAIGELPILNVFGNDYPTIDGTCIRDYIHVVDLAKAHIAAIDRMMTERRLKVYNIGTGRGYSVLEIIKAYEKANNLKLNYTIVDRRPGDAAKFWSNPYKANKELHWDAELTLEDMCRDSYNFIKTQKEGEKNEDNM